MTVCRHFQIRYAVLALTLLAAVAANAMTLAYEYDITREKTPTAETLRRVADVISSLGYTQLQLYFKDNFAYPDHPAIWRDRAHLTPEEVTAFDAYCRTKGLSLVPYQSSFGHLEPWMAREEYRTFAEHPSGRFESAEFDRAFDAAAVCPTDPRSLDFLNGLFDVLLPCFSSPYANLGCDEVWDLHATTGRSAAELREKGIGRVYLDFILKLRASLASRGKTLMFWSDIIRSYPELVKELPSDVIALDWNYEAHAPFAETTAALKAAPCRFYVCPGTSSWNSYFGRHANMRANVSRAFRYGRKNGAEGLLLTDWGDGGYPQPWLVSLPAIVYASVLCRTGEAPSDADLAAKVDAVCGCRVGAYLIRLANAYLPVANPGSENGTQLYRLASKPSAYRMPEHLTADDFACAVGRLRAAAALRDLSGAPDWVRDDAALLDLLVDFVSRRVAGEKGSLADAYRSRYTELWLRQNRPQGVEASVTKVFGGS